MSESGGEEPEQSDTHGHAGGGHAHGGGHSSDHRGAARGDHAHAHGGHAHAVSESAAGHGHGVRVEQGFVAAPRPASVQPQFLERDAGRNKVLYLDCPSGISGNMVLGAFLDLGVPRRVIDDVVEALGLKGVELDIQSGYAGAIGCLHVDVRVSESQPERSFVEIRSLLEAAALSPRAKSQALAIFSRLAEAEASVHRTTVQHVHFHEVGAVDALVDIVGSAACVDYLGARVVGSSVPLGRGFVECRHGTLPLPAPAALLCLENIPTVASGLQVELVTPTGAAILATVAEGFSEWMSLRPQRVGWGAGTRGLPDRPNALRMVLGEATGLPHAHHEARHVVLEANLDDTTGELIGHVIALALERGALDAWAAPVTMKKGRPGVVLGVLSEVSRRDEMAKLMLRETTTLGVRQHLVSRHELSRRFETVSTQWGPVRIKVSGDSEQTAKPEWSDCEALARQYDLPVRTIWEQVMTRFWSNQ